jgi:hypothetical protein
MAKVKISYSAPGADVVSAAVGGTDISFSGTAKAGSAQLDLPPASYGFTYFIEGQPGSPYEIKIEGSTPNKTIKDTIAANGKAAGGLNFIVAGAAVLGAAVGVTAAAVAIGVAAARRSSKKRSRKASSKKASTKAPSTKASSRKDSTKKASSKKTSAKRTAKKSSRKTAKKGGRQ